MIIKASYYLQMLKFLGGEGSSFRLDQDSAGRFISQLTVRDSDHHLSWMRMMVITILMIIIILRISVNLQNIFDWKCPPQRNLEKSSKMASTGFPHDDHGADHDDDDDDDDDENGTDHDDGDDDDADQVERIEGDSGDTYGCQPSPGPAAEVKVHVIREGGSFVNIMIVIMMLIMIMMI